MNSYLSRKSTHGKDASQASIVRDRRGNRRQTSATAETPVGHKALLFASKDEAVVYLTLMGFTIEDRHISYNGLAMATHRTLFALDWLCGNGFTYAAPTRE
jgi:hypothetical protein